MPLSWNEIKSRAATFSKEWELETSEDAEAKSFWDDFFNISGISRRRVATFEQIVDKLDHTKGYIDLLWKGVILIEHKSRGKDLDHAYKQAKDYFPWPESPAEKNIKQVEAKAQKVLDTREEFPDSSLADLYDPLTMPPKLVKAHNELDKAFDLCYRSQPFVNETKRIEFLFELYEKYTAGMFRPEKKEKRKGKASG